MALKSTLLIRYDLLLQECLGLFFFCAGLIDCVLVFCKMLFRSHLEGCGENALFITTIKFFCKYLLSYFLELNSICFFKLNLLPEEAIVGKLFK